MSVTAILCLMTVSAMSVTVPAIFCLMTMLAILCLMAVSAILLLSLLLHCWSFWNRIVWCYIIISQSALLHSVLWWCVTAVTLLLLQHFPAEHQGSPSWYRRAIVHQQMHSIEQGDCVCGCSFNSPATWASTSHLQLREFISIFGGICCFWRDILICKEFITSEDCSHTTMQHMTFWCSLGVFAGISVLWHSPKPRWCGVSSDSGSCVTSSGDFGDGQLSVSWWLTPLSTRMETHLGCDSLVLSIGLYFSLFSICWGLIPSPETTDH